ncbi:hypothetical protein [Paenibacillus xylanexedens]|uniref:hypothetical protein n=1 Tax=Paenibacillus xylanexedens TaxID=528191 RepID=UPI0011A83D17|nr:hypothetical protein [Paenibacillus xylanexedens]
MKLYNRNDLYIKDVWDGKAGDEIDMCVMQGGKKVRRMKEFLRMQKEVRGRKRMHRLRKDKDEMDAGGCIDCKRRQRKRRIKQECKGCAE